MKQEVQQTQAEVASASVIGADIVITGNIEAQVDLHIEGRVLGDVRCATLVLGAASRVDGSIYAERVRVSGTVNGAIETKDLAVEATAEVEGDITYQRLRVANGGSIQGKMKRTVSTDSDVERKLRVVAPEGVVKPKAVYIE